MLTPCVAVTYEHALRACTVYPHHTTWGHGGTQRFGGIRELRDVVSPFSHMTTHTSPRLAFVSGVQVFAGAHTRPVAKISREVRILTQFVARRRAASHAPGPRARMPRALTR